MFSKSVSLMISSALLSSAIIFHAWYPIQHGPEAARLDWISKCVAIKDSGKAPIRLSDIPVREPIDLLAEEPRHPADEYAEEDRQRRYEIEQNCMATYAIVVRGGR